MAFCTSILFRNLFLPRILRSNARYGSALFVPGNKATEICVTINPHIDLKHYLNNIDTYKEINSKRRLEINLDDLKLKLECYMNISEIKRELEKEKSTLQLELDELRKADAKESAERLEKLRHHFKIVRDDLKSLKTALWPVEERIMINLLNLPNIIHPKTPNERLITYNYKEFNTDDLETNHVDLATKSDLLVYNGPFNYYLKDDAALFELGAKFFFSKELRNIGYVQFSNPDFVKSLVVEGCGSSHTNPDEVFIIHHNDATKINEDSRLHLTGGGSLFSFAAYHTRHILHASTLPLRYFSLGRQYKPVLEESKSGLFNVAQSSVVELFLVLKDCEDGADSEFEQVVKNVSNIYEKIGYPFRVCYNPIDRLNSWESLRVSFEMYSRSLRDFVEVGHVSMSGDYISKRLQFSYREKKADYFPRIISGTVLNVPKLLGCILEHDSNSKFVIPVVFNML